MSGIAYYATTGNRPSLQNAISYYRSNIHAGILGVRLDLKGKADLYFAYSIIDDTGGDRVPFPAGDPLAGELLTSVQTFPLVYQSPSARLSVRITSKIRWNAGYQFYNYNEKFQIFSYYQNFNANTGYTSVLWSF